MRLRPAPVLLLASVVSISYRSPDAKADSAALAVGPPPVLSPDGRWFACNMGAGLGPARLLVCESDARRKREVGGASDPIFAADSKSLTYSTVSREGFEYVVRDLETWATRRTFRFASSVSATPDRRHLVIKGPPGMTDAVAGRRSTGADGVFIYSIIEDRICAIGPASSYGLSGDGQFLALAKAGPDGRTSLEVLRLGEDELRRVYEVRGEVASLAWGDDHRSLGLVVVQDKPDGGTTDLMVVVDDATAKTPRVRSILPEEHAAWPRGAFLDPGEPRVGIAGAIVYFVVRDGAVVNPRRTRDDEVEIHRAFDGIIYDSITDSLTEGRQPLIGWIFAWIAAEGRIIKVADADQASVVLLHGGRRVLVPRSDPASSPPSDRPDFRWDVIDPVNGTRQSLGQGPASGVSGSRTGRYVAYFEQRHWWVNDAVDGTRRDLSAAVGPSFEAELAMGQGAGRPIAGAVWLEDDSGLIVHDRHDAWLLRPDGTAPRRLTRGRERGRVYRLADSGGRRHAPGGPYYFHVVETRSKYSGYVRVGADGEEVLIDFGPWAFDRFTMARDAERFAFLRESYDTPPNFFTATPGGGEPCPMTELKVEDGIMPRPARELIQYRDRGGAELQGTLVYPIDYDRSKKYPMVVSIYSIRSDRHFRFHPRPALFDDPLTFASRGYFVLLPDIVYRPREPGPSAVDCVESAVRAVLRRGGVDPRRISLAGISLGGYEVAFILSKSKLFAAGVAASPVADWASHGLTGRRGSVYPSVALLPTFGMRVPFWTDPESYIANSLFYQAHGITTPLLIGVGRQDYVVDCRQGEGLFNLLRYLKRPAYLLAYSHGGHGLGEDFGRRARQFFDHYLKGEPPPGWMAGNDH